MQMPNAMLNTGVLQPATTDQDCDTTTQLRSQLGDLSGMEKDPINDEFEFYVHHFERPMEKNTMEAIQGLIEKVNTSQKKGHN